MTFMKLLNFVRYILKTDHLFDHQIQSPWQTGIVSKSWAVIILGPNAPFSLSNPIDF